jgi:hypothetical protein
MKQFLFILFSACIGFSACSSGKKNTSSVVTQGLAGLVTEQTGNQMPMKGAAPQAPRAIQAEVLIYEPTNISQVTRIGNSASYTAISTKRVASVITDSLGAFSIALPPGTYSVFVMRSKQFYANIFDSNNYIALFTVEAGKLTRLNLSINSSASY